MIAALEGSPAATYEWPSVSRVLEAEALASLLNISVTSLRRYLSGERETPAPAALLAGDWNPDDPGPQKVRDLAASLVALSAT